MNLKQRQANFAEAPTSRAQVEVSARHGRSIMYTIVAIVFLPMSVLATIFGMNVKQLDGDSILDLRYVSILFPVSFAIAILALILASNETQRELLLHALREMCRFGLKCTGLERLERIDLGPRTQIRQPDYEEGRFRMHSMHY